MKNRSDSVYGFGVDLANCGEDGVRDTIEKVQDVQRGNRNESKVFKGLLGKSFLLFRSILLVMPLFWLVTWFFFGAPLLWPNV
jgi:hypothetical protein